MASVDSTQVQMPCSFPDADELTQPEPVLTQRVGASDGVSTCAPRVAPGGARQSATIHESARPSTQAGADAGILSQSRTVTSTSAATAIIDEDWSPTRISSDADQEGSGASGSRSIPNQHEHEASSSTSKKKRKSSSKGKRKRQSEAKDASPSDKQADIKMMASNCEFMQIEQKYGAKWREKAIKWLWSQIKLIKIAEYEELTKQRQASALLQQVEHADDPKAKRARKRARTDKNTAKNKSKSKNKNQNKSKNKSTSKARGQSQGKGKGSNSAASANQDKDRSVLAHQRSANLRPDEVEWPHWNKEFRHDTRPFIAQQPSVKEADTVTLFPAAYARLMAELARKADAAREQAQLAGDTTAMCDAQAALDALSAMALPPRLASRPFVDCTISRISAPAAPLADAEHVYNSSAAATAADNHCGLGSGLELLQVELTEVNCNVAGADSSRDTTMTNAGGGDDEPSIRVIFQREEAQMVDPHLLLREYVQNGVTACIERLKPGTAVKMQFQHPENPSVGLWYRGRVYDMLAADRMSLDPFESIKVVWYDEECETRKLSLRYEQTDNVVSPWDIVPDENVKVKCNDTDDLITRTFSPSSTAADVVNFVRNEKCCEAAIVFNDPLPKKSSVDGAIYHARIAHPIFLGNIRRSCLAGRYDGAAGMILLWSELELMTANAKCFNQVEVAPWRAADMMEIFVGKIRTAIEKSEFHMQELDAAPAIATADGGDSDCESTATVRAD